MMTNKVDQAFLEKYAKAARLAFFNWKPFEYQRQAFEDLFLKGKKYVFCEWARASGKTQVALTFCTIAALMYPKSSVMYVAPTEKDAKEILHDKILNYIDPKLMIGGRPAMTSGIVKFQNGSRLYIRGSESKHRGKEPTAVVYDEFRDFNSEFHNSFSPVMRLPECRLLIISTPPYLQEVEQGRADHYDEMIKICKSNPDRYSFYQVKCWEGNPLFQEFYKEEQTRYKLRGEYGAFETEYLLKRTRKLNKRAYLSDIDRSYLYPHYKLLNSLEGRDDLEYVVCLDCSGLSRWGVLFAAIDERQGHVYLIDCLVVKSLGKFKEDREEAGMSVHSLWPRVEKKCVRINDRPAKHWRVVWDSADVMLMDEVNRQFGDDIHIEPVSKKQNEKLKALATIRDLCLEDRLIISERCDELIEEFQSLQIDPRTEQPKPGYDDLTACLRYIMMTFDYCLGNTKPELPRSKGYYESKIDRYRENRDSEPDAADFFRMDWSEIW